MSGLIMPHNGLIKTKAPVGGYSQNWVDSADTAWMDTANNAVSDNAQMTFGGWFEFDTLDGSNQNIWFANGDITVLNINPSNQLQLRIRDSSKTQVLLINTTSALSTGTVYHIYVTVDLSVPSYTWEIDGSTPATSTSTSLAAGTGSIGFAGKFSVFSSSTGSNKFKGKVTDFFFETGAIRANSLLYNSGTPLDLTSLGSPTILLGDSMTADERDGDTAQGWNDYYNIGSVALGNGATGWTDA